MILKSNLPKFSEGKDDPGGNRWPPTCPLGSKQLFSSLVVFTVFWVLNFRGRFEALNDIFWQFWHLFGLVKSCSSWINMSNGLSCTLTGVRMQKLRSREVDVSTNHLGPTHFMTVQILGLCFWMFMVFEFMLMLKKAF